MSDITSLAVLGAAAVAITFVGVVMALADEKQVANNAPQAKKRGRPVGSKDKAPRKRRI